MMMSEDEMIAVEADLVMALNIHDSQPMRPTPTPNNGGDGNHDHGGAAVVSALRSTMTQETIWKKMRAGRRKRPHQFLLEGVKDVEQDSIKDNVEEGCRSKNVLLLPNLGFKNQSDLIDTNITTTFSVMSSSNIQHQVVKNNNQKEKKKKKKKKKKKMMMMMMKKAVKNIPQQATYTVTKVAPMRLVFRRVHSSSENHSQNNDGKGKKRKMNDAGLEELESKITKLRLTMSDSKRATSIVCQRAPFNPIFDLNLIPCFA